MRIRLLKNITVDVETKSGEVYDKAYSRWQEVRVEDIYLYDKFATITLEDGNILHDVPGDSFEKLTESKKVVSL